MMRWIRAVLWFWLLAASAAWGQDRVRIETSAGDMVLQLFPQQAPQTVANFLEHVDAKFYDGLIFHRVVANFVIQAGGYEQDMKYRKPLATVVNESANGLRNERGTVAMARLADPDSADAQFYINLRSNPSLDARPGQPGYTVFGRVIEGMDVADAIELSETMVRDGMSGVPVTPIVIRSIRAVNDGA
jgi:cyclophilin family peptidyl-prolyl cis-trans isomerase